MEKFSKNQSEEPKRGRGRPRLLAHRASKNEQNDYYANLAREVLSASHSRPMFQWILESKTLLTEIGRIKDPHFIASMAERISNERRLLPNGKYWPTAQAMRSLVQRWRMGNESKGSFEQLQKELESLIERYRARHPKLKKRDVTRTLNYLLYIYKGTPWGNNRPDRVVQKGRFLEIDTAFPSDPELDREENARARAKKLTTPKHLRNSL